ncbi:MAG: hypothetical protein Q8L47_02055 [bacterium]|nr:hypothetical protein [bacterium]
MQEKSPEPLELSSKKPLEPSQKKRIDSFFIHQCIIRRFKGNYRADYEAILSIRNEIESILCLSGLSAVPKNEFEMSSTEVAMASMNFFENSRNRNLLISATAKHTRDRFYKHLSQSINSTSDIKDFLSEDNANEILEILQKNIEFYDALIYKYNIFDYFSLFSMTVYIPFDKFYTFYRESFHGKTELYWLFENVTREAKWLYVNDCECEIDSNIYISIISNCYSRYFYSSNISIFDDDDNDIVINGDRSTNALYLKVPTDQSPNNIDGAIEYYKNAIVEKLINSFGCMSNTQDDGFENSKFMRLCNKEAFFVTQWNCIDKNILGLWCWDLMKNDGNTKESAVGKISERTYKPESSIKNYYDNITRIISFNKKENEETLDKFVTGSDKIILGLRDTSVSSA